MQTICVVSDGVAGKMCLDMLYNNKLMSEYVPWFLTTMQSVTGESHTLMDFLILQDKKDLTEQPLSYPQTYISSLFQWSSALIWKCERKVGT